MQKWEKSRRSLELCLKHRKGTVLALVFVNSLPIPLRTSGSLDFIVSEILEATWE